MLRVGVDAPNLGARPDALRRAVARLSGGLRAVELHEHRVVDLRPEAVVDSPEVRVVAVRGELHALAEARREIAHEVPGAPRIAGADVEGRLELRVRVDRGPRPDRADEVPLRTFAALARP